MLFSMITAPLVVSILALYSLTRLLNSSEFELIVVNLCFILLILFPRLRSKLVRRRTFVNAWIKEGHWTRELLQGGSLYLIIQLLISIPAAFLLLIELQHITVNSWYVLIPLSFVVSLGNLLLRRQLSGLLKPFAAGVIAREWSTYIFAGLSAFVLGYQALYATRPDLSDRSLQEALLYISESSPQITAGFFSDLIFLSALKETTFWWAITAIPHQLTSLPEAVIWLCQLALSTVYILYQISVVYALSLMIAGALEIADPSFYAFMKGRSSERHKSDSMTTQEEAER